MQLFVCVFVCLFGVYRPTQEVFTHMETSPLQVKGCKFWPLLDIRSHWVVRVLQRATPTTTCTQDIRLYWSSPRTRDTHTYYRAFSSGAVTTCFYKLGLSRLRFEHTTFRLRDQRSYPLRHRRGHQGWRRSSIWLIVPWDKDADRSMKWMGHNIMNST